MDSKPLKVLMTIVGVLAGIYVARHAVDWFRGEPAVPAEVLTKQWVVQSLGGGELRLEAPWPLNPTPVELPSTISKNVESSSSLSIEKDGLYILAARLKMIAGLPLSLAGAADGTTANLRNVAGTVSVDASKKATTVSGTPAYDVSATIHRQRGDPMTLRGLIVIRGQTMYQVLVIYRADQARGEEAWKKMRNSLELRF